MQIKLLGKNKLQITLLQSDLEELGITYESLDYMNPQTRKAITELLRKAKEKTSFQPERGKLLIEVYPLEDNGCAIYFTTLCGYEESACEPAVFPFSDADLLIDACCKLYQQYSHRLFKSSAYYLDNTYYLVLYSLDSCEGVVTRFLTEYSHQVGKGRLMELFLAEHGKCLIQDNAVDTLCGYFGQI